MKAATLISAFITTAAAVAVKPQTVSYDGYKVFRVPVGNNVVQVNSIIEKLDLQTWKSVKKAGAYADIVVAPHQLKAFNELAQDIEIIPMHDDLGTSIAKESNFQSYAGACSEKS